MHSSRNFHAFTEAYLAHAQTNFPAAAMLSFLIQNSSLVSDHDKDDFNIKDQIHEHVLGLVFWDNNDQRLLVRSLETTFL